MGEGAARLDGPKPSASGWGGKLANGVIRAVNGGTSTLMDLGIEKREAQMLTRKSAEIILGISTGNWDKINIPKKGEFWANVLKNIAIKQGDAIDKNVSTDVHHLIRLPGTIHGDTGLIAKKVKSLKALAEFDPMKEAIAFGDAPVSVRTAKVPEFTMAGTSLGRTKTPNARLPAYAASYLVLKGFASLKGKAGKESAALILKAASYFEPSRLFALPSNLECFERNITTAVTASQKTMSNPRPTNFGYHGLYCGARTLLVSQASG